jgi:hypothetical protein
MPKPDFAEPLKAELAKLRIAFDAPTPRATEANLVFAALRRWLGDPRDDLAFRQLLQAVADGGALGIPTPRARKQEKVAERQDALVMISDLWNGSLRWWVVAGGPAGRGGGG